MKKAFSFFLFTLLLHVYASAQDLLRAVDGKDYKAVEVAIKAGENVNAANEKGMFPLWLAVWNQDARMVDLLLRNGANAKQTFKGEAEIALLDVATQEGPLDVVQLLVKAGADYNKPDSHGQTPLRTAARNGHTGIVKYLLAKGAEVDTKGNDGATSLEHAASKGHLEIVKLLVEKGANVNVQDKEGDFALGEAARHGFLAVVSYLLDKGADVTLKNGEGNTAEELARLAGQPRIQALLKQKRKA
jgi:ankyrin repeat protein